MPHLSLDHVRHTVQDDDPSSPFCLSLRSSTGKPQDATISLRFKKGGHEQEMALDYNDLLKLDAFLRSALPDLA